MKTSKNISITMPADMLKDVEKTAEREGRTISELIRETYRQYAWQKRWNEVNTYGRARAKAMGLTEKDVNRLIQEYRSEQKTKSKK